jgi:uncharacterized membrane protein
VKKTIFGRWRASFLAGLAVTLPALLTIAAVKWLFGTISSFTDTLLFFLPKSLTHEGLFSAHDGRGDMIWYWSLVALVFAALLISLVGILARYYIGVRILGWLDAAMLNIPLLNKFYAAIKQMNEAFSGNRNSFKTVVLVEFPHPGSYSVGFITSDAQSEVQLKAGKSLLSIFIPTTPNPTSGFLVLVPEEKVTKLDMTVSEGIKYIVSLGSLIPEPPRPASPAFKNY